MAKRTTEESTNSPKIRDVENNKGSIRTELERQERSKQNQDDDKGGGSTTDTGSRLTDGQS
jgi:hypothetical protein